MLLLTPALVLKASVKAGTRGFALGAITTAALVGLCRAGRLGCGKCCGIRRREQGTA